MAQTKARGYAIDTGEFRERVYSIGSAILLPDSSAAGALGISIPDVNLADDSIDRIGGLVAHAADTVTSRVGLL